MSASAIRAGRAFVELFADSSKLIAGLKLAEGQVRKFGANVTQIGQSIAKVGALIVASLVAAGVAFSKVGDDVQKLAIRTGLTTQAVSELAHAAGASGTSIDTLEKSLRKMQQTVTAARDGTQGAVDSLALLGVEVADLQGMSPEEQLEVFADRIAAIEDPSERAARAMAIFGKSGTELIPLLEEGGAGIRALRQEARDLGLSFEPALANAAAELNDALGRVEGQLKRTFLEVGAAVAPVLNWVAAVLEGLLPHLMDFVRENQNIVAGLLVLGGVLTGVGTALIAFGKICVGAATTMGALTIATAKLKVAFTALAAHPILAMLLALSLVAAACAVALGSVNEAQVSSKMYEAVAAGDAQAKSAETLMQRLEQLASQQQLSNAEMSEAKSIVEQLNATYGDLGISIDETTGKINGLSEAQQKFNKEQAGMALARVNKAMRESGDNIEELQREMEEAQGWWASTAFGEGGAAKVEELGQRIAEEQAKFNELRKRRNALTAGDESAVTGQPTTAEDQTAANVAKHAQEVAKAREEAISAEERWAKIEEQEAAKRRGRLEQELKDIADLAEERRKLNEQRIAGEQARVGGPRQEVLDQLASDQAQIDNDELLASAEATGNSFVEEQAALEAERQRLADQQKQQDEEAAQLAAQRDAARAEAADEVARLEIELNPDLTPLQKQLKLIGLDYQREMQAALEAGVDPDLITRKFDLQKQLAEQAAHVEVAATGTTTGSFSALAAQRSFAGGTAQDRTAKATEETARNTKKIIDEQKNQKMRFS